jgi:hypothetical protein
MEDNMLTAECPCCHGKKELEVVCEDMPNSPIINFPCAHCDDTGRVKVGERYFICDDFIKSS